MNILKQLWIILFVFIIGELIVFLIPSPLPGNVVGFIIMICLLQFKIIKSEQIEDVSNFFLNNLAIFFIPGGVGLLNVLNLFNGNILKIILIVVISTILTLLSTAGTILLMEKLKK
ncbi:MAG: CidA/LrgA family protein [Spirochaetales bacterium]|nr:CidA/LrgA family protein [Spirochaetales bacterium]